MTAAQARALRAGDVVIVSERLPSKCGGVYSLVLEVKGVERGEDGWQVRVVHEKWLPGKSLAYPLRMVHYPARMRALPLCCKGGTD